MKLWQLILIYGFAITCSVLISGGMLVGACLIVKRIFNL